MRSLSRPIRNFLQGNNPGPAWIRREIVPKHAVAGESRGDSVFRMGKAGPTAGAIMAEGTGSQHWRDGIRQAETEAETFTRCLWNARHWRQLRKVSRPRGARTFDRITAEQANAVNLADAGGVHLRKRPGIGNAVRCRQFRGVAGPCVDVLDG